MATLYRRQISGESTLPTSVPDIEEVKDQTVNGAIVNTVAIFISAVLFAFGLSFWKGGASFMEFMCGYIVELSLSVDNLFVFIMLFEYFKVPIRYQNTVLTWGIIGAVLMRGVMIFIGVAIVNKFKAITLLFSAILLFSAYKLFKDTDSDEDLENNMVIKFSSYFMKSTTEYDGQNFFIREFGKTVATPLFVCLICIEISDLIFAIDSIPAVLGVSHDTIIVYSSNIFAIMGLRSLFTILSKMMHDLKYLKPSVGIVLGFVAMKMMIEYLGYEIPVFLSLFIICGVLFGGVYLSWGRKK